MAFADFTKDAWSAIDVRVNLKHVYRRLQLTARFLIVGTFMDDAVRVLCDYRGQVYTMKGVGWGNALNMNQQLSQVMPAFFILTQAIGVFLVLSDAQPQAGCVTLLLWAGVHPFLYAQQRNLEFLLESVTIIGGLLILLSSERMSAARAKSKMAAASEEATSLVGRKGTNEAQEAADEETGRLLLLGRVFLSAVFVYYVVKMINERIKNLSSSDKEEPLMAVVYGVLLVFLMVITGLIVMGMKSRWCAMLLAFIMGCAALYKHPWYITMWSKRTYALDFVVGYEDVQVDAWLYSDHQRYFFFQQLSTVGALMQLVVHGPGKYSIDEAEGPEQLVTLTVKGAD